jgi:hypothetical protein
MNGGEIRILDETAVEYFKVVSLNLTSETSENQ